MTQSNISNFCFDSNWMTLDVITTNSGTLSHRITLLLTEAYIDDEEVSDVKWQDDDFSEQHDIEL